MRTKEKTFPVRVKLRSDVIILFLFSFRNLRSGGVNRIGHICAAYVQKPFGIDFFSYRRSVVFRRGPLDFVFFHRTDDNDDIIVIVKAKTTVFG